MAEHPDRGPQMDPRDHALSMRISPRARRPEDNEGLRTLLVHRLTDTHKAVARISLRGGQVSIQCEPCGAWTRTPDDEFPNRWRCLQCRRVYEVELAVLEEVNDDERQ